MNKQSLILISHSQTRTTQPIDNDLLSYYLTFNRAEGQSLDTVGLLLPQSVFSHGHLYEGYSRCGDPAKVFVYADQEEFTFTNLQEHLCLGKTYTRNIVWPEVFGYNIYNLNVYYVYKTRGSI